MSDAKTRCEVHGDDKYEIVPGVWRCVARGAPDSCVPVEADAFDLGLEGWV